MSNRCQAMILAAGRGERMRPLTDSTPKPLLSVRGQALLSRHLEALAKANTKQVLINTAWLEEKIHQTLGATQFGMQLQYSAEGADFGAALETAGGIVRALPKLAEVFWVVAGDVYTPDFVFDPAVYDRFAASDQLAHLFLVPNPAHNTKGDFALTPGDGQLYTFSTIAIYKAELFQAPYCSIPHGNPDGLKAAIAPMLRHAIADGKVSTQLYTGTWIDVGTPQRLAELNQ